MAVVSVSDVELYMNVEFDPIQAKGVQLVLDLLHSDVEGFLRRPLEPTSLEERWIVPDYPWLSHDFTGGFSTRKKTSFTPYESQVLRLNVHPIVSVESLKVLYYYYGGLYSSRTSRSDYENEVFDNGYDAREGFDYTNLGFGLELYNIFPYDKVLVTYTGGVVDQPEARGLFRSVILRAAVRESQNMHDDSFGVKDLSQRQVALQQTGLTKEDKEMLSRYRKFRA